MAKDALNRANSLTKHLGGYNGVEAKVGAAKAAGMAAIAEALHRIIDLVELERDKHEIQTELRDGYKGCHGTVFWDPAVEEWHGRVTGIGDDVVTFIGKSPLATIKAFRDSVDDYLEAKGDG